MNSEVARIHAVENPLTFERYLKMKQIGREIFHDSHVVRTGEVDEDDIGLAYRFVSESARATDPEVFASYWNHMLITPEYIRRLCDEANSHGMSINTRAMVFAGVLHDAARLAYPAAYARNDLILDRMLVDFGIPSSVRNVLPSFTERLELAAAMNFSADQLAGNRGLNPRQNIILGAYFRSLTPEQIIFNLADNLAKRNHVGVLSLDDLRKYLLYIDGTVYAGESQWPSMKNALSKRQEHALFQWQLIRKSAGWLKDSGISLENVMTSLKDFGPRLIVAVRHGEVENPKDLTYNRDSVMEPEDVIHLSDQGRNQSRQLGELLNRRRFKFSAMRVSPNNRTRETAAEINRTIGMTAQDDTRLDDPYAPNIYRSGITIDRFIRDFKGDAYDAEVWGGDHEQPGSVAGRMTESVRDLKDLLAPGEAALIVTHGDTLAWFLNQEELRELPTPASLRDRRYPPKGSAVLFVYGPDGNLFTSYYLNSSGDDATTR